MVSLVISKWVAYMNKTLKSHFSFGFFSLRAKKKSLLNIMKKKIRTVTLLLLFVNRKYTRIGEK